ncbi:MAG: phage holin family protein [Opitutales bacterium]|nr:phage holin family protein [Opitutales bacterium]
MNEEKLKSFFRDALIIAFGVLFAAWVLGPSHIQYSGFLALLVVAMIISFLNAFLRPMMLTFAIPFLLTTFGLGAAGARLLNPRSLLGTLALFGIGFAFTLWFINACIFSLASLLAGNSFIVHGFGSAMLGSVFTSLATLLICGFFGVKRQSLIGDLFRNHVRLNPNAGMQNPPPPRPRPRREERPKDDDVIDI